MMSNGISEELIGENFEDYRKHSFSAFNVLLNLITMNSRCLDLRKKNTCQEVKLTFELKAIHDTDILFPGQTVFSHKLSKINPIFQLTLL